MMVHKIYNGFYNREKQFVTEPSGTTRLQKIRPKIRPNLTWQFEHPGFPHQADHNLTILWHDTNHTNFYLL